MTQNDSILSEQASLYAHSSDEVAWSNRINDWNPVARLGETFLLNSLVSEQAMPHTRLLPPETLEKVGSLLAQTLHDKFDPLDSQDWAARATLTDSEVFDLLGFKISDLPRPYKQWRFSTEVYALIEGTIFLLLNDQFVRHRRLSQEELTMVLSPRTAPFQDNLERNSGIMLAVVAVPGRLGSLSGLRGERRSLVDAGQAIGRIQKLWSDSGFQNQWSWELEFYDDTCTRALGIDGLERLPIALAYKIES